MVVNQNARHLWSGATPIFAHHNTKGNSKNYEPPELEDMAWAGFAEFARQWLLIGRRELYEIGSGVHKLWMNIGSSAGFNGCYGVDVEEGTADGELRGRRWQVSVRPQRDIITQKMQLRGEKNAQKACDVVVRALGPSPLSDSWMRVWSMVDRS